ncbi:MAG TPA: IS4 family transposase [Acetobacteraceae bacterium]|nr:IS4 family transposase [Acetobacteraceae bacterium]
MVEACLGRFGDHRLAATGAALLGAVQREQTMCLHALAHSRAERRRFTDFLDNPAVSRVEMLVQAGRLTGRRASGRHVLAIADTSELNFAGHAGRKRGFGKVGNGRDIGVFVHPVLALDAERGGVLGLVDAEVINRAPGPVAHRRTRAAEEKESRRWLTGVESAGAVLAAAASVTMVEDREGDIYDQFARRPETVHLLVRAARDRSVGPGLKLFATAAAWPEVERHPVTVPAKRGTYGKGERRERTAEVAVRFGEVQLSRPASAARSLPAQLRLRVVDVREVAAPPQGEPSVHWCLLTTHAVETPADALRMVRWYRQRWTIEQLFRSLKTAAMDVEQSQITMPHNLSKLVTIGLIAATRVMQVVIGRDGTTGQPLSDAIAHPSEIPALQAINATLQGRTDKLKNPFDPASLAWYAWIVARMGGWSGYTSKGYRPPGPKTIARGLRKIDAMVAGWQIRDRSAVTGLP